MPLRILITNSKLSRRSGSELYVWDLANALLSRGHSPIAYTPVLGRLATALRAATIPVVDDLRLITAAPDLIHGHHNHEILTALLHFPGVPAVRICHGWSDEQPLQFPRILRTICVDHTVRDRLVSEWGVPEAQIQVILNFVDLSRFQPRGALPARPAKALVFSNAASQHLPAVKHACGSLGIAVDAVGQNVGRVADAPETLLGQYDVVFAKARCALEAMASGTAVVLCDAAGLGPLVTSANFDHLRTLNFGVRTLRGRVTPEAIVRELAGYDAQDAAEVTRKLRATAGMDTAVDALIDVYEQVLARWRASTPAGPEDELPAAAAYLRRIQPREGLRQQAYVLLRDLYFRARSSNAVRWMLPWTTARRLGHSIRGRR